MNNVYSDRDFDAQPLNCPKCNWSGNGSNAIIVDLYAVTDKREIHCPECDTYLGGLKVEDKLGGERGDQFGFQIG